jgi:flagellar protein FlgJ
MSVSVGSNSINSISTNYLAKSSKVSGLEATLKDSENATDEELMEACKSFESYLLEQVFKGMEKTIIKDEEEENDYLAQFGDKLYEEYAKDASESGSMGIAQILYESMKRNS